MDKTKRRQRLDRIPKNVVDFGPRGFFGIGIHEPGNALNMGGLWRSAMLLGASWVFTIGMRYQPMRSDTQKAFRHIPLFYFSHFDGFFESLPQDAALVAVEQTPGACALPEFTHPERAVYLLGHEDQGLPHDIVDRAAHTVHIPVRHGLSLNVHVAGSLIMYDRLSKSGA